MEYTRKTTLSAVFPGLPRVVTTFARYGVRTVSDLRYLSLADWWRPAPRQYERLLAVARRAEVWPIDTTSRMLAAAQRPNFNELLMQKGDVRLANTLAQNGVLSLMLVTRLRETDLLGLMGNGVAVPVIGRSEIVMVTMRLQSIGLGLSE